MVAVEEEVQELVHFQQMALLAEKTLPDWEVEVFWVVQVVELQSGIN